MRLGPCGNESNRSTSEDNVARRRAGVVRTASPQDTDVEAALLREIAVFMHSTASTLESLIPPANALHRRLVGTATFQRVDGLDDGDDEPIWSLAGTLDELFEEDVERVAEYLRRGAELACRSLRDAPRTPSTPPTSPLPEGREPETR